MNRPGTHIRSAVARSTGRFSADDPAEGADGVALVGQLEGRRRASSAVAAPQGLLCLRMHAAGSANWRISRRALSRSSRLLYESSLPCRTVAVARFGPRVRAPRRRRPAGAGSRRTGAADRSVKRGQGRAGNGSAGRASRRESRLEVVGDHPVVAGRPLGRPPAPGVGDSPGVVPPWTASDAIRPCVLVGVGHDGDVLVVLGRRPDQAGAADVDVLDRLLERDAGPGDRRLERVQVHDHQVDRLDALSLERRRGRSGTSRRARMPPWILGWSVLTRPPRISGWPV